MQQGNTQQPISKTKRATAGFIVSLIGGILVLVQGLIRIVRGEVTFLGADLIRRRILGGLGLGIIGIIAVIFAILIIIGAYLIYNPSTVVAGSLIVIVFSALSIIAGGGFIIGLIVGMIGGIIGLTRN